jgi:hypothetical protein
LKEKKNYTKRFKIKNKRKRVQIKITNKLEGNNNFLI